MLTRYRGILVVAGAVGLVWIGSLLQLFRAPDGWVYDRTVRLGAWEASGPPSVLMVENDPRRDLGADDGVAILDYLQELGARQIIFLSLPRTFDARFYERAREHGKVIAGQAAAPDAPSIGRPDDARRAGVQSAGPPDLTLGDLSLPPAESGVHRLADTRVMVGGRDLPTLAMAAARNLGLQPRDGLFRVNFNQGADWIPRVSVERVLGRGLIPELVRGRSVVIGRGRTPAEPGLYTPIDASGDGMSLLEYQALAIDTLLQDKPIRSTPWIATLPVLGLIGLLSLVVYQWFNLDRSSWFTVSLVAGYLAVGWLLLHGLLLWIPVVEIAVGQVLMFWLFVRLKLLRDDAEMRHTALRRMAKLQDYMLPPDFYKLDEHWGQVITFVDQTLNLNRVIFLEKVEGDHRVREVQALRCSLDDIDERRRDFERVPYSDAIAEGGPIKLTSRLFFKSPAGVSFEQYLVPLLFGGGVQGFWAFDVDPMEIASSENFLGNLRNFGSQIAELLYHRHRWQAQRSSEPRILRRVFGLEAAKASSQEVGELLGLLDNRLHAAQAVFDGLATATIHYDLFGRVVQLNKSMERFMKERDLPGFKLTALDLLVKISRMPEHRARRLLQQVVVDRRNFYIPVQLPDGTGENYSVHVRPLIATDTETASAESTAPFGLAGILFELSDERELKRRYDTKEQLLEWVRLKLHDDLTGLLEDATLVQQLSAASGSDLQMPVRWDKVAGMGGVDMPQAVHGASNARPLSSRP